MDERPLLNDFLYEAIYIPDGVVPPPRSIILNDDLQVYVRDFGMQPDDRCLVAEVEGRVAGAVWTRIMKDYGHVGQILQLLRQDGYHKVSLSVLKENYAAGMYLKAGFEIWKETPEEYIMVCNLVS